MSEIDNTIARRGVLHAGTGLAAAVALLGEAQAAPGKRRPINLNDPNEALIASRKCAHTLEDNVETFSWMDGTVFALFDDGKRR